jgi:hypothetical protein
MILLQINWQIYIRAKNDIAWNRVLARLSKRSGIVFEISAPVKRYKNDLTTYRICAKSELKIYDIRNAYHDMLITLQPISNSWILTAPDEQPFAFEGSLPFSGGRVCSIPGITSLDFQVIYKEENPAIMD